MYGLFTTKEIGRKNKWNERGQLNRKVGLVIDVSQLIPKLNELHLLFTSTWLSILRRLKQNKTVYAHDST